MASKYYGSKGSRIREYQRILNALGARLKVDGIWGKLTEAAYNKYMDAFEAQVNPAPPPIEPEKEEAPIERLEHSPRDEEALRRAAEQAQGSAYDREIYEVQDNASKAQYRTQDLIDALGPQFERQLAALIAEYAGARQLISDDALSRGLGRSSYVTDRLAGNLDQQLEAEGRLHSERDAHQQRLSTELARTLEENDAAQARLSAERERAILAAMDVYRREDQSAYVDALKYNNALTQTERDRAEQIRQFEEQLKVAKAKIR